MLFIETQFKEKDKDIYRNLLASIDEKLHRIGKTMYENYSLGQEHTINRTVFEDLIVYRTMLIHKMYCDDCLCNVDMKQIISRILTLTNSIC